MAGPFDSGFSNLTLQLDVLFPSNVVSGPGVTVNKTNSVWTVGLDYPDLTINNSVAIPSQYYIAVYDTGLQAYEQVRLDVAVNNTTGNDQRTAVGDANYACLITDRYVAVATTLTAIRTITLPGASTVPAGRLLTIQDETGAISPANYITIAPNGGDTIDGYTSWTLRTPRSGVSFRSNGTNAWNAILPYGRAPIVDSNYTALFGDQTIAYTSITAPRTVTLPTAASYPKGQTLLIVDESGGCSATNTITIVRSSTDTINGATSQVLAMPYAYMEVESNGTNAWTIFDGNQITGVQLQAVTSINGAPLSGFKNLLINGDFRVSQLNGPNATTPTGSVWPIDRWLYLPAQPSKLTFQQVASTTPGGAYGLKISVASAYTAAAAEQFQFVQRNEGLNTAHLQWGTANAKTVTLSGIINSTATGNIAVAIQSLASSRSYVALVNVTQANTDTPFSVTIPGDTAGTWPTNNTGSLSVVLDLGSGSNYNAAAAGAWSAGNFSRTAGQTLNLVATAAASAILKDLQLEQGATATAMERRSIGEEDLLARRYFRIKGAGTVGSFTSASTIALGVSHEAMRNLPTYNLTTTAPLVSEATAGGLVTRTGSGSSVSSTISSTATGAIIVVNGFASATAPDAGIMQGDYIIINAEL